MTLRRSAACVVACVVATSGAAAQHAMASRDFFYVGGAYAGEGRTEVMTGQMYVEVLRPQRVSKRYPLVFFHGAGQTATNWIGTPDGRAGWADYFLNRGYVVYLVDQPARGRSAWRPSINGPLQTVPVGDVELRFTAPEKFNQWPQASTHTQWPGDGEKKGLRGARFSTRSTPRRSSASRAPSKRRRSCSRRARRCSIASARRSW